MKKIITLVLFFVLAQLCFAQKTELVLPSRHEGGITDMAFSQDRKYMATTGQEGSVILWDAKLGIQLKKIQLIKKGGAYSAAFSKDGKLVAVAAENMVAIIDVQNTMVIDSFHVESTNTAVAFTPDNKYLLSCGWGSRITVWRTSDRKQIAQFIPYEGMYDTKYKYFSFLNSLSIAPDGKSFATGDTNYGLVTFKIPDEESGWKDIITTRTAKDIKVKKLEYVGTGKYLVVLTDDNLMLTLDTKDYSQTSKTETLDYGKEPKGFSNVYNDNFIYVRYGLDHITKVSLPDFKKIKVIDSGKISLPYIQKESGHLYATTTTGIVAFKDETLKNTVTKYLDATSLNKFIALSPNGKLMAINTPENLVIFDLANSNIIKKIKIRLDYSPYSYSIKFDHSGKSLYVNEGDKIIQFSVIDWKIKRIFQHPNLISSFKLTKDDKHLAITDHNTYKPSLKIWNTTTGLIVATKVFETGKGLDDCDFSDNGKYLAIVGVNNLQYLNFPTLTNVFTASEETTESNHVLFAPGSKSILSFKRNAVYSTSIEDQRTKLLYSEGGPPSPYGISIFAIEPAKDGKTYVMNGPKNSIVRSDFSTGIPMVRMSEHNGMVRSISFSGNGKFYATAAEDGQIILRNDKNEVLCSIFTLTNQQDWVITTPSGRFDATVKAQNQMYYHKGAAILPLASLFEKFYTPRLLPRLILEEIFPNINVDINDIKQKPVVKMNYAETQRNLTVEDSFPSYQNVTGFAEIIVNASSKDDLIDEIRLYHNGKVLNISTRNLIVEDDKSKTSSKKYTVNLLPGSNSFRAISLNSQRTESDADQIEVIYKVNGAAAALPAKNLGTISGPIDQIDKQATLHLMVVGINAYTNKINPLTYALPDATAFKEEIEKDAKSVLANVKTYFINDAKANSEGIKNALNEIKKNAKPKDVFIFYYAGHGYIHPTSKEFYLVSADVTDAGESLLKNGIAAKELQNYAVDILAQKQLFILDACQSAGAYEKMLKHDGEQQKSLAVVSRSTGTHWIAASGSTETAKEFSQLGHGAFTYVLLQALKGQASNNKMITVNGLKDFLQIKVPEVVKKYGGNSQLPSSYGFGNDFPVEIIK